tara:strand:+ start:19291 stop:21735 length:2445 start_codon:yes stop_codon:yes gene_type:complete
MSGVFGASQLFFSGAGDFYGHSIGKSLRFEDGSNTYLSRTPSSTGDRKTWTWSAWIKRCNLGTQQHLAFAGTASTNRGMIYLETDNTLRYYVRESGVNLGGGSGSSRVAITNAVLRDTSSWYHILVAIDTTQATSSNRTKIYINGTLQSLSQTQYPNQDTNTFFNSTVEHAIGHQGYDEASDFDGYMAEINFVDGQQLNPTSFGETKSGVWIPKNYTGTYGTNGYNLEFVDSSNIGEDTSGNTNNYTPHNFNVHDVVSDSPTNNFSTLLSTTLDDYTVSEGNLRATSAGSQLGYALSNHAVNHAFKKFYFEARSNSTGNGTAIGIVKSYVGGARSYPTAQTGSIYYTAASGAIFSSITGATEVSAATYTDGDVIGVAVDGENNTVQFFKNGVSQGTVTEATIGTESYLAYMLNASTSGASEQHANFGQDSTFSGLESVGSNADENGIGAFHHSVPSGFLALCTKNFAEPPISPKNDEIPEDYFNTVLYTGDDSTSKSITGVGFQPDWVWIKARNSSSLSHGFLDSVRGVNKSIFSNATSAENSSVVFPSFDSDGFTVSDSGGNWTNENATNFVAWNWLAGGTAVSNTDGGRSSTVSANQEAGFSIVKYTGDNTTASVGHGLGAVPDMIIVKCLGLSNNWIVFHTTLGANAFIQLNLTNTQGSSTGFWGTPSTTTFGVHGTGTGGNNRNGQEHIAYCFTSIDGYSKFGEYTGNGSNDGTFVFTGFRPAWVMLKRASSGVTASWAILDSERDPINPTSLGIFANSTTAEASSTLRNVDFLSNGFKLRTSHNNINGSGGEYIYMAFAEIPFKYSNAR